MGVPIGTSPDTIACICRFFRIKLFLPFCSSCSLKCCGGCRYLQGGSFRWHFPCKNKRNRDQNKLMTWKSMDGFLSLNSFSTSVAPLSAARSTAMDGPVQSTAPLQPLDPRVATSDRFSGGLRPPITNALSPPITRNKLIKWHPPLFNVIRSPVQRALTLFEKGRKVRKVRVHDPNFSTQGGRCRRCSSSEAPQLPIS